MDIHGSDKDIVAATDNSIVALITVLYNSFIS